MTRLEKLQSDRRAILAEAEQLVRRLERDGREPNVYELRAFDARIAAADRLEVAINKTQNANHARPH